MSENAWMCENKQDPVYASGPNYAKILNTAKLWMWQGSHMPALRSALMAEYALREFWIYLGF